MKTSPRVNSPPGPSWVFHKEAGSGLAEFLAAHPSRLVRLPDTLPDEVAVLTDSLASALQPVLDHFPQDDDTVVIYGAGIIGQHLVRLLRALGSKSQVIMVARYPFQHDLAQAGGADLVLMSPGRAELGQAVGARLLPTTLGGGNLEGGADLCFDCVGSRYSMQEGLLALRAAAPTSWWAPPGSSARWISPASGSGNSRSAAPPCTPTAPGKDNGCAPTNWRWTS